MQQNDTASAASQLQNLSMEETDTGQKANSTEEDPSVYEETHVHSVYESIADHFSATRYSPWPLVARFLEAQPAGSIGLDVGCGNGKYLSGPTGSPDAAPNLFMLGSDRSAGLAQFAQAKHARHRAGADVLLADSLALPFRDQCADFVVCIAVVHHLSTRARRQEAVRELLRCVRPKSEVEATKMPDGGDATTDMQPSLQGRVLVYVWALEQASSRRGWTAGGDQDLLVPWVKTMKEKSKDKPKDKPKDKAEPGPSSRKTAKGEKKRQKKQRLAVDEQLEQPREPESKATAQPTHETHETATTPTHEPTQTSPVATQPNESYVPPVFHRYYHLYREGELAEDVEAAGGRVVASGYEKDNWWAVADVL